MFNQINVIMEKYDYRKAVEDDVRDYIEYGINPKEFSSREKLEEYLQDVLWTSDGVTGYASGSYTFNTWQAEEYLCHNLDLLEEACEEFGEGGFDILEKGAEAADVAIRCYLLNGAISEVIDEMSLDFDKEEEE